MSEVLTVLPKHEYFLEDDMQKEVEIYLKQKVFYKSILEFPYKIRVKPTFLREFYVKKISRRSDHIIYFSPKKMVNIECKKQDIIKAIEQATDHLRWANYSLICLPMDSYYIPNKYKREIIDKGLGLILWLPNVGVYQLINPKYNRSVDELIRKEIRKHILLNSLT